MKETAAHRLDDRSARRRVGRRRGVAALLTVGTIAAASLVGIANANASRPVVPIMNARAFNVAVATATLGVTHPIVGPIEDTGMVSTTTSESITPPCTVLTGLIAATGLCNAVLAFADPADITAATSLAGARIGVTGLPVIVLGAVNAVSHSTCDSQTGAVTIAYLSVGTHVVIGSPTTVAPNTQLVVGGIKLVLNQQVPTDTGLGLRVNALHVSVGNATSSIYVTVGHAETLIKKCPTIT